MIAAIALIALALNAQQAPCPRSDRYCAEITRIMTAARVRNAVTRIERTDAAAVRELIALTQIPAPPFKEAERGRAYAELLRAAGADSVRIDEAGNVIALRRGVTRARTIALSGHLDTVFPEGTDVRVKQRGDTLFAPGIADNTRGLIAVLQVLRALVHAGIRTDADLLFIGTVGEEGIGDLRGTRHLFRAGAPRIDALIVVDGAADDAITNTAIGSRRYRVTFSGPGGHSWGAFGTASPIHALARAIERFDNQAARFTASGPTTTYNIGRIGGGTSVNSIAAQAWAEVDMRSANPARLAALDSMFHVAMVDALNEQNALRRTGPELSLEVRLIGNRPSGRIGSGAPIVQRALAATRAVGLTPRLDESSTDANVPISRGIPAITLGRGGVAGRTHSPGEWWLNADGTRGLKRLLYVLLAEAGWHDRAGQEGR
ncbi:MAG: M20/M25/M40 family metallo-hydrolase [Gemmatimonadota bacterium]